MDEMKEITLLVQTGSFGLLCVLAIWVIRWVPKRIERADQVREAEAKSREEVAQAQQKALAEQEQAHIQAVDRLLAANAEQQRYERENCERRHKELLEAESKRHEELLKRLEGQYLLSREIKHEVANLAQGEANRRAAEELRRKGVGGGGGRQ